MKLAIVGSRTFNDYSLLEHTLYNLILESDIEIKEIVSGGARGADSLAKQFALDNDITYLEFKAAWDLYGKSAGYKRNVQIVEACDAVLAFWDGESKGTKHSIDLAKKLNKKVTIVRTDE